MPKEPKQIKQPKQPKQIKPKPKQPKAPARRKMLAMEVCMYDDGVVSVELKENLQPTTPAGMTNHLYIAMLHRAIALVNDQGFSLTIQP